ncbi:MarR family winged helix-turn-helix transcriptional regulator [Agromyces sp. G08B096]|uniref:MarR family winged helix-turn-helix transcriptional regulator n=1 Tax=Agromyces sp. G08B096 TaxID=3156399 RepID=A0AAU7W503_9MICO
MTRSDRKTADPDLGMLAARVLFAVQREFTADLRARGVDGLRPKHGAVLAYLDEGGSRATDLARRSGQHKQVIGTLVDELTELGYVRREPDPADRRAKLVVPTERGLEEMRRSDAIVAEFEARCADALGASEYGAFKDALRRVAAVGAGDTAEAR